MKLDPSMVAYISFIESKGPNNSISNLLVMFKFVLKHEEDRI